MAFSFNSSTITYTPAIVEIRSMTFDQTASEIDVSNAADSVKIYEAGQIEATATVEINGDTTVDIGTSAALTYTWNSGDTDVMSLGLCTGKSTTGSVDNPITTTLTFKNTQA